MIAADAGVGLRDWSSERKQKRGGKSFGKQDGKQNGQEKEFLTCRVFQIIR